MSKITVFECPGTSVAASMAGHTIYVPPEEIAKNSFYKGLDPDVFSYVFVQGYTNVIKPMGPSVAQGVQILTDYINNPSITPGKFALIGTSQGALITSQIVKKLVAGTIPRLADCIGSFHYGNPAREQGKAFPGAASIPGGRGISNSTYRLTSTPSWVWEFANPGDPVCTNDPTTLIGPVRETVFNNLLTSWDGRLDSLSDVADIANDIIGMMSFAVTAGIEMQLYHCGYDSPTYKPGAGDPRTGVQIVIDYLNKVAGPSYRPDGWSTTLRPPTS